MSELFDCSDEPARERGLSAAAAAVRAGRLVVLPTDTVYGVAAAPADPDAVRALLAAKQRTAATPSPVLIADPGELDGLAAGVSAPLRRLASTLWPGGLTIVVPSDPALGWQLGATGGTVALRVPDNQIARALLRATGPLAVSSANLHGQAPARDVASARRMLGEKVAVYLDGGRTRGTLPSTIVTDGTGGIRILRHGLIPDADIASLVRTADV